jgi:hypothetical protein
MFSLCFRYVFADGMTVQAKQGVYALTVFPASFTRDRAVYVHLHFSPRFLPPTRMPAHTRQGGGMPIQ